MKCRPIISRSSFFGRSPADSGIISRSSFFGRSPADSGIISRCRVHPSGVHSEKSGRFSRAFFGATASRCRIIAIAFALLLGVTGCNRAAYAQNRPAGSAVEEPAGLASKDEEVNASDLGVSKPRILPTNALYVFKDLSRGFRTLVAAGSLGKAELGLRFADEGLIEIQSVSAQTKDPNVLKPVLEHYQREISSLRKWAESIHIDSAEATNDFLTRLIDHQLRHYKFLGRLEKDIEPEAFGALKHAAEEVTETVVKVPLEFENPESFRKRLEATLENQKGSRLKDFQSLKIVKALEEKAPEAARDALRHAEENISKRFLELPATELQGLASYIRETGGNEILHFTIIEDLEQKKTPENIAVFEEARDIALRRIEERLGTFGDDAQKQEYLDHLGSGNFEDIVVVRELEKRLSPEILGMVLEVKAVSLAEFKRALLQADTFKKRERLLQETERVHGMEAIEAAEDIESVVPEDNREILAHIKRRAAEEVKRGVTSNENVPQKPAARGENNTTQEDAGARRGTADDRREDAGARRYHKSGTDLWGEPRAKRAGEGTADDERSEEDAEAARASARRALEELEKLSKEKEFKDARINSAYQSLLRSAKNNLKESEKDSLEERHSKARSAFYAVHNAEYTLKNLVLYPDLRENKIPGFLGTGTQNALASILSDLTRKDCGKHYSFIAVPLICKNGQWQRAADFPAVSAEKMCRPTGCSGQVCADQDVMSACEFKPEYACYKTALCERQPSGECGWTRTQEFQRCIEKSGTRRDVISKPIS